MMKKLVYIKKGNQCHYCKIRIANTIDHVIPKSKGGNNWIDNLVPSCRKCNRAKGNKSYFEFTGKQYGPNLKEVVRTATNEDIKRLSNKYQYILAFH